MQIEAEQVGWIVWVNGKPQDGIGTDNFFPIEDFKRVSDVIEWFHCPEDRNFVEGGTHKVVPVYIEKGK